MRQYIALTIIALLAFVLRAYQLTTSPEGLYIDETSIGYNAYSLIETGKDEHGKLFPLFFEAFGEWKLPVYIYSVAFFQLFLGPNDASVRLPAVLYGTGTVVVLYFLVKELVRNVILVSEERAHPEPVLNLIQKSKKGFWSRLGSPQNDELLPLLASFLLAISPWHYLFSRPGHEAGAALFFEVLGLWLFLKTVRIRSLVVLIMSLISFVLTLYSYNSARIVTPVLLFVLIVLYYKSFSWKQWFISLSVSTIIALPFIVFSYSPEGLIRAQQVSIFFNPPKEGLVNAVMTNYWLNISPKTLFVAGDFYDKNPHEMGLLHIIELPFFYIGIVMFLYFLIKRNTSWKEALILLILFFISFIPGAITWPNPLALRSLLVLPATVIFSSIGVIVVLSKITNKKIFLLSSILVLIAFLLSEQAFLKKYHQGYVITAGERVWQTAIKKALLFVVNHPDYSAIYLSLSIREINAAWYLKWQPEPYSQQIYQDTERRVYHFVDTWEKIPLDGKKKLYITDSSQFNAGILLSKVEKSTGGIGYTIWEITE